MPMNKEIFAQTDRLVLENSIGMIISICAEYCRTKKTMYAYESAFSDSEVQRICLK